MKTALLMLIFVAAGSPASAKPYHVYQNSGQAARSESSQINCATSVPMWANWVRCRPRRWLGLPG